MSLCDYEKGREIGIMDYPFYAIIQAAMRLADTENLAKLQHGWPEIWTELIDRYRSPGGELPGDALREV